MFLFFFVIEGTDPLNWPLSPVAFIQLKKARPESDMDVLSPLPVAATSKN